MNIKNIYILEEPTNQKIYMIRALSFAIFVLSPLLIFSQEWESSVQYINSNLQGINSIRQIIEVEDWEEYQDSLRIINDSKFENLVMEVYTTQIEFDSEVEYVTAIQIPLSELISVSKNDYEVKLGFSKDCSQEEESANEYFILEIPDEKQKYIMHAAFNHLRFVNKEFHERKHRAEICTFGKKP
ncbi:hypothetical protein NE848_11490 [Gramella jeungdoensis]|uniref:Uncharacterized protein n=1 Tax=Gramella jeungdoensis TaxID=708091 RepID=A0ABT0Z2Q3_9FLAO|nr:hypothetical protein [Gramella jeungdoensis]MCM8570006.1 hypothetical protein [Gramella jeungdoensis]